MPKQNSNIANEHLQGKTIKKKIEKEKPSSKPRMQSTILLYSDPMQCHALY